MGGNLGLYLWLTRIAKKMGGPVAFVLVMIAGGVLVGLGAEAAVKKLVREYKKRKTNFANEPIYTVIREAVSEDGMDFMTGDQFRVLMQEGEYALVERLRGMEHRILSISFLKSITEDDMK